jgi:hypothetical protein
MTQTFDACTGGKPAEVEAAKKTQKAKYEEVGIKTERFDRYIFILNECSKAMNAKNDNKKSGRVSYFVSEFASCSDQLIESQTGMRGFKKDVQKQKDVRFKKFYEAYKRQEKLFQKCRGNSKKARDCFNAEAATICSEVVMSCHEAITMTSTTTVTSNVTVISTSTSTTNTTVVTVN